MYKFDLTRHELGVLILDGHYEYNNHWVLEKIGDYYEATYDGLYKHIFISLEDLLICDYNKAIINVEYSEKASDFFGEETFTDENDNMLCYIDNKPKLVKINYSN